LNKIEPIKPFEMIHSIPSTFSDHIDAMIHSLDTNDKVRFSQSYAKALDFVRGTEMEIRLKLLKISFDRLGKQVQT